MPARFVGRASNSSVTVEFAISPEAQAVMRDPDFVDVVEPGARDVWIGGSSDPRFSPGVRLSFQVAGEPTEVARC